MQNTPKSLRLQIGLFGRTNVGKSSLLNCLTGQSAAITSPVPGTTTDVVEKAMELLPVGPVLFLDTAGLDDRSMLASARIERTMKIFDRADIAVLVLEAGQWTGFEEKVVQESDRRNIPLLFVINKTDLSEPTAAYVELLEKMKSKPILCAALDGSRRETFVIEFKKRLLEICPESFLQPATLAGDLVRPGGLAVLVVPIDLEAPKGRLILPQVQAIRDLLDADAAALVVKEREYAALLDKLKEPPDLVVCDSQVVLKTVADTPVNVPCTTFSILFARLKGDLDELVRGAGAIETLRNGDRVLIGEACTHHAVEDDIGRVKIPRWLRQYTGLNLEIDTRPGIDFPPDLAEYKLVVHCGGCMLNRRAMLSRIQSSRGAGVPITNYGVCISYLQGVLERTLAPFPGAIDSLKTAAGPLSKRSIRQTAMGEAWTNPVRR